MPLPKIRKFCQQRCASWGKRTAAEADRVDLTLDREILQEVVSCAWINLLQSSNSFPVPEFQKIPAQARWHENPGWAGRDMTS